MRSFDPAAVAADADALAFYARLEAAEAERDAAEGAPARADAVVAAHGVSGVAGARRQGEAGVQETGGEQPGREVAERGGGEGEVARARRPAHRAGGTRRVDQVAA